MTCFVTLIALLWSVTNAQLLVNPAVAPASSPVRVSNPTPNRLSPVPSRVDIPAPVRDTLQPAPLRHANPTPLRQQPATTGSPPTNAPSSTQPGAVPPDDLQPAPAPDHDHPTPCAMTPTAQSPAGCPEDVRSPRPSPHPAPAPGTPQPAPTVSECSVADTDRIGNSQCDVMGGYNTRGCNWDGGDCCQDTCRTDARQPCDMVVFTCLDQQSGNAGASGTCLLANPYLLRNGYCDGSANSMACAWDGGDCCVTTCVASDFNCSASEMDCLDPDAPASTAATTTAVSAGPPCQETCPGQPTRNGDGHCDDSNNVCSCNWDAGDCCGAPSDPNTYDLCEPDSVGTCCQDPDFVAASSTGPVTFTTAPVTTTTRGDIGGLDEHGCCPGCGESYCATLDACYRPWHEACPDPVVSSTTTPSDGNVGADTDEHGCCPSCGENYCETTGACYFPWLENCAAVTHNAFTDERTVEATELTARGTMTLWASTTPASQTGTRPSDFAGTESPTGSEGDSDNLMVIIGVVCGLLFVAVVVIVAVVVVQKRKQKTTQSMSDFSQMGHSSRASSSSRSATYLSGVVADSESSRMVTI